MDGRTMKNRQEVGKVGEDAACRFLQERGYDILERNFKCRYGEIDIIAFKEDCLHFIEVKCRRSLDYGIPAEAVNSRKIRHIIRTAGRYMALHEEFEDCNRQIDVMEVIYGDEKERINHLENAVWQEGI